MIEPALIEYLKRRIAAAQAVLRRRDRNKHARWAAHLRPAEQPEGLRGPREALADKAHHRKEAGGRRRLSQEGGCQSRVAEGIRRARGTRLPQPKKKVAPEIKAQIFRRDGQPTLHIALPALCSTSPKIKKPDGERLPHYHDADLQSLKFQCCPRRRSIHRTEKLFMTDGPESGRRRSWAKTIAYLQAILKGGDDRGVVDSVVDGTKLADPACARR